MSTGKIEYMDDAVEMYIDWKDDDDVCVEYGDDYILVIWREKNEKCRRRKA